VPLAAACSSASFSAVVTSLLLITSPGRDADARALPDHAQNCRVAASFELFPVDTHDFHIFWSCLPEAAQVAASQDLEIIRDQMSSYQVRLDLWYQRVWELQGLWVDPEGNVLRYGGTEVALTGREAQLLRYKPAGRASSLDYLARRLSPEQGRLVGPMLRRMARDLCGDGAFHVRIDCALVAFLSADEELADDPARLTRFGVFGCEAGGALAAVNVDGYVAPCEMENRAPIGQQFARPIATEALP